MPTQSLLQLAVKISQKGKQNPKLDAILDVYVNARQKKNRKSDLPFLCSRGRCRRRSLYNGDIQVDLIELSSVKERRRGLCCWVLIGHQQLDLVGQGTYLLENDTSMGVLTDKIGMQDLGLIVHGSHGEGCRARVVTVRVVSQVRHKLDDMAVHKGSPAQQWFSAAQLTMMVKGQREIKENGGVGKHQIRVLVGGRGRTKENGPVVNEKGSVL